MSVLGFHHVETLTWLCIQADRWSPSLIDLKILRGLFLVCNLLPQCLTPIARLDEFWGGHIRVHCDWLYLCWLLRNFSRILFKCDDWLGRFLSRTNLSKSSRSRCANVLMMLCWMWRIWRRTPEVLDTYTTLFPYLVMTSMIRRSPPAHTKGLPHASRSDMAMHAQQARISAPHWSFTSANQIRVSLKPYPFG